MKLLFIFLFQLFLISCSSVDQKLVEYRKELYKKEFKKAEKLLTESKIKKDDSSKLLFLIEKATLRFYEGQYEQATRLFQESLDLYDLLYTKSISKKIKASVLNSNFDEFTGSAYEISMVYFFQAISYYQLSLKESDPNKKKSYQGMMRATVVAWDTFFKTLQRSPDNKNKLFLDDFFARTVGATLHESLGTRQEFNTAYILYQDALKILEKIGPTLKIFNSNYDKYIESFLDKNLKLRKKYSNTNDTFKNLVDFLHNRIINLALKIRPSDVKRLKSKFLISDQGIKTIKEDSLKTPLTLYIGLKQIPEKIPNKVNISLKGAYEKSKDPTTRALIRGIGLPVLTIFASRSLGLSTMTSYGTGYRNNIYMRGNLMEGFVGDFGISFELPSYPEIKSNTDIKYSIYDQKNKKVIQKDLILSGPIYDLAKQDLEQDMVSEYWRTGSRVALKYIAAMASAYTLYQTQKNKKEGSGLGMISVLAGYYAASKGIEASERADLRHWGSLPANVFTSRVYLEPGKYTLKLESGDQVTDLGSFVIEKDVPAIFSTITN